MDRIEIKPGVFWVGGIDWTLRDFHGYKTQRGSTYNAYLIMDEKITLVDTVKHYLYDEMVARISAVVDPSKIDLIISNHVEMDHTGSIPKLLKLCPNAKIVTSSQGKQGIVRHYKEEWDFQVVKTGDTLNIGKRTLHFVTIPMVHWPDSMVTCIPEDKLLLPNDAFGQHIASSERYDDEIGWDIVKEEAAKYYANIVLPFGMQVKKALEVVGALDVDMIGPSHGVIWRSHIPQIIAEYGKWASHQTEDKALIVYDTMWGSTKIMADKLKEGLLESGMHVSMRSLKDSDISDVMTDVLTSKLVLIGSPTLNNGMLPTMGAFLTYLKGLWPRDRVGLAFGSYGWGGQAVGQVEEVMKEMGWETPLGNVRLKYIPDPEELEEIRLKGKELGELVIKRS
ncbi:MAG: FprA family A-type flavoprotein [Thermoplasmata archaeon]|nr:FprA family A-type flavoprotein [Thermoplasmata archaeon]